MNVEGDNRLVLDSAPNVDEQLELIRGMPEVEEILFFDDVDLTATGMKHIGTLPNLVRISTFAPVGDEGLLALRDCKSLRVINIYDSSITLEAIAELQSHTPKCRINTIYEPIEDRP